jgi:hypothetical protein
MNNCVLLKSYGRAGSHLIIDWFLNLGYEWLDTEISSEKYIDRYTKNITNVIIKDHGITYIPKFKKSKNILLKRRDILALSMSELVAERTRQWVSPFTNKKYKSFLLTDREVTSEIKRIIKTDCKREKLFKKKRLDYTIIFYEDFANNPKFLNLALNMENNLDYWTRPVSPYKAQDLILNYEELREKYKEYVSYS